MKLLVVGVLAVVWLDALGVYAQVCTGRCVPRNNCQTDDDDPPPDVDLRVGQEDSEVIGNCSHYLDLCCPLDMIIEEPPPRQEEKFRPCGQRNPDGVGFRLGGGKVEEAEFGEFPWSLLVLELQTLFDFEAKEVYVCVASLVAPNVALTVAHCVVNRTATNLVVRAGEWDTRTESEVLPYQTSPVKEILKDADVCSGDGGAALVCSVAGSDTSYYQAGIVAWGIGCGDENIPGVYVDVANTRSWIVENLNSLNVDPAFYTSCSGRCVRRDYCLTDEDDPAPDVDLRVGQKDSAVVGNCSHYLDLCCPPDLIIEEPHQPATYDQQFSSCGKRNPNGVGFRLGEGKVEEAEFAPNVALTVAHCVVNRTATNLVVRAGEWDTRTEGEVLPYQTSPVKEVLVHEGYNKRHHNNVALLVLQKPFQPAKNVQTVCLPPPGVRPATGEECITGGWGKDRFGKDGVYQHILKRVSLPIVDSGRCREAMRKARLGQKFKLHNTSLCAGGKKDADVCSGDGGAALVCPVYGSENSYYQAGIVAWGIGCGDENIPGVYVDVTVMLPWIVNKLNALNVDPAFYTAN
ncbi:AGAP011781-PA-like protein [Anopheles sinensis]|uniref:AGAP011781-PA-like protein n=1 Tax=Anopheles sinensis TaxID=74873 RepID=A0A084WHP9_ANOSI|nr:AGAP011781-PA-like protein [Anopheles sinensis]